MLGHSSILLTKNTYAAVMRALSDDAAQTVRATPKQSEWNGINQVFLVHPFY
jgi:hypothetical protein